MNDVQTPRSNTKTTRDEWLAEAQNLLIEGGVEHVKIEHLAKNLSVTRGGFYWFFKNRADILQAILDAWQDVDNDPLMAALEGKNKTPIEPFYRFFTRLLRERSYSPKLDSAMRDWARISTTARKAINMVDNRRILALHKAFIALGYEDTDAFIRARILYFHQIGYYAMNVREDEAQRQKYLPLYFKQLTGFELPQDILEQLYQK